MLKLGNSLVPIILGRTFMTTVGEVFDMVKKMCLSHIDKNVYYEAVLEKRSRHLVFWICVSDIISADVVVLKRTQMM